MFTLRLLAGLLAAVFATAATAHSGSTAYLQGRVADQSVALRWDLALRDLDDGLALDEDRNSAVTWGEVQDAQARINAYALSHLSVQSESGPCPLQPASDLAITEHAGEPYAVLALTATCSAKVLGLAVDYQALFDVDASHRGLFKLEWPGRSESAMFAPERRQLRFGSLAKGTNQSGVLAQYFKEGLFHVWTGYDHMLFLAGLFLAAALVRTRSGWRPVARLGQPVAQSIRLVTAFTIAHAITLCLAALGVITLPTRLVESAVAATVLFSGANNLLPMVPARWLFSLCWLFGLIHGTAIAGALLELGLPASGRVMALLGFNLGVEAAQLAVVAVVVPLAFALRNWPGYPRWILTPGSTLVMVAGAIWLANRALALELRWPF